MGVKESTSYCALKFHGEDNSHKFVSELEKAMHLELKSIMDPIRFTEFNVKYFNDIAEDKMGPFDAAQMVVQEIMEFPDRLFKFFKLL